MALTDKEESDVRSLLGAVAAAGVDVSDPNATATLTRTLRVGATNVQISLLEARIIANRAKADQAHQDGELANADLTAQVQTLKDSLKPSA